MDAVLTEFVFVCRSLDLTGPLLLGGVPNLPEDFPVLNRDFVGCMGNLTVDSKPTDMASFIANNGTNAGDIRHMIIMLIMIIPFCVWTYIAQSLIDKFL